MRLDNYELYNALKGQGIQKLYHANTLTTALSFISLGGVTSRGNIERLRLPQTEQDSDYADKQYNVWNDIFLDTVDLHGYRYGGLWSRENAYGPILFELNTELLLDKDLDNIWITTENPQYWEEKNPSNYFFTVEDYIANYNKNRQKKMITIRGIEKIISLQQYLSCIYIDDPKLSYKNINLYDFCYDKILAAIQQANLTTRICKHHCSPPCYCRTNYFDIPNWKLEKLFLI